MGRPVFLGVNLAITYGLGLIGGALVVAAVYMALCARNARLVAAQANLPAGSRRPLAG